MSETSIVEAIDGAEVVRARTICGIQYVAVWHGGVGVNVYCPQTQFRDTWDEVCYFTLTDEHGQPVESEEIEQAMVEHFNEVETEARR